MIRVAINGFGRIGRLVFRRALQERSISIVAINDLTEPETLAHLLKYDSVHGPFPGSVEAKNSSLIVNNKKIICIEEKQPNKLPWKKLNIDLVLECTGRFRTKKEIEVHLRDGAKKVLLSAPAKGKEQIKTIVIGVNEHTYNGEKIVSNASCTTNCFAPMAKIVNDAFTIVDGVMTTIHSYTNDQRVIDTAHPDLRRARAASLNIIPTSTGAAKAIGQVIPELNGKIIGAAIRVPTPDGSMVHFVVTLKKGKDVCKTLKINQLFKKASEGKLKNILQYTEDPIVSSDIIGNPHSCIFDAQLTECVDDKLVVVAWYDNEWGYSCRMVDLIKLMTKK